MLIGQHDARAANDDLGVANLAGRARYAQAFDRAERPRVEFEGLGPTGDNQVGRNRVIAVGNGFRHAALLRCAFSRPAGVLYCRFFTSRHPDRSAKRFAQLRSG
jgi:hypothetical protein